MKMIYSLALLISLTLSSFSVFADTLEEEIRKTLSCHRSYKPYAPEHYEVFEREGLVFSRGTAKTIRETNSLALVLSITDGQKVYSALIPTPNEIDPKTKKVKQNFYWYENKFRLEITTGGQKKSFCVSYTPNMVVKDELKEFAPTPPASCADAQTITAQPESGKAAIDTLEVIQSRIHDHMRMQVRSAKYAQENPSKTSQGQRDMAERMDSFTGSRCYGLNHDGIRDQLTTLSSLRTTPKAGAGSTHSSPGSGGQR